MFTLVLFGIRGVSHFAVTSRLICFCFGIYAEYRTMFEKDLHPPMPSYHMHSAQVACASIPFALPIIQVTSG